MPFTRLTTIAKGAAVGRNRLKLTHVTSPNNPTLLPAPPDSVVQVFRKGATSAQQIQLYEQSSEHVAVSDAGDVQVGDILFTVGSIDGPQYEWFYISEIAPDRSWVNVQYSGQGCIIYVGTHVSFPAR